LLSVLSITAFVLLNLYLGTPGPKSRLQSEVETILGSKMTVSRVSLLPTGRIKFTGIGISGKDPSLRLTAETATLVPDFLALLGGNLRVTSAILVHPVLHLSLPAASGKHALSEKPPENITSPSSTVPDTHSPRKGHAESIPGIRPQTLGRIVIHGGELVLFETDQRTLLAGGGIEAEIATADGDTWFGKASSPQVVLGNMLSIHHLLCSVKYSREGDLLLEDLRGQLGGGTLTGSLRCSLPVHDAGEGFYNATAALKGATLQKLLSDLSYGPSSACGDVSGFLELHGSPGIGKSMTGHGEFLCNGVTVTPADFLKQIGQLLQIEELRLLRLSEAKGVFRIMEGTFFLQDLLLRSENVLLTARGGIGKTGDLDLDARLLLNERLSGRLQGILGPQLAQAPERGYSQIPFHVSGSPYNPRTDLLERLVGIRIGGGLGGILQGLFGRPAPSPRIP
jgi:hypothetical protein